MLYRKIHLDTGWFIEDIVLEHIPTDDEGKKDPQFIELPVPGGFYQPKWNGTEWVEGAQAPEVVQQEPTLDERTAALEDAVLMMME